MELTKVVVKGGNTRTRTTPPTNTSYDQTSSANVINHPQDNPNVEVAKLISSYKKEIEIILDHMSPDWNYPSGDHLIIMKECFLNVWELKDEHINPSAFFEEQRCLLKDMNRNYELREVCFRHTPNKSLNCYEEMYNNFLIEQKKKVAPDSTYAQNDSVVSNFDQSQCYHNENRLNLNISNLTIKSFFYKCLDNSDNKLNNNAEKAILNISQLPRGADERSFVQPIVNSSSSAITPTSVDDEKYNDSQTSEDGAEFNSLLYSDSSEEEREVNSIPYNLGLSGRDEKKYTKCFWTDVQNVADEEKNYLGFIHLWGRLSREFDVNKYPKEPCVIQAEDINNTYKLSVIYPKNPNDLPENARNVYWLPWSDGGSAQKTDHVPGREFVTMQALNDSKCSFFITSSLSGCRFVMADQYLAHISKDQYIDGKKDSSIGGRDKAEKKLRCEQRFSKRNRLALSSSSLDFTESEHSYYGEKVSAAFVIGIKKNGRWTIKYLQYTEGAQMGKGVWKIMDNM